jgi:hypothetical protein
VEFVRTDPDNRPVLFVHALNLKRIPASLYPVIIELVPDSQRCEDWAWKAR